MARMAVPREHKGMENTIACVQFSSVQFSRSVVSDSLQPHEPLAACQASLPTTNSRSPLTSMSIESVLDIVFNISWMLS